MYFTERSNYRKRYQNVYTFYWNQCANHVTVQFTYFLFVKKKKAPEKPEKRNILFQNKCYPFHKNAADI